MSDIYIKKILAAKVYDIAIETPIDSAVFLSKRINNKVLIKREDLQPVFSFKLRGAYNKMNQLTEVQKVKGVIAASAGNHAQGVALAAKYLGIEATIVMPKTTPKIKVISVKEHGANVILYGDDFNDALEYSRQLEVENGFIFIHPYDDPEVIAGQGTIGMEILRQYSENIDAIFIPVGGGGLAAGVGTYIKYLRPEIKVIAVESNESACLKAAFENNSRVILEKVGIFADGVAVKQIGEETFKLLKECIDGIVTVTTDEICAAVKDLFEDTRSISEPAGALALAGLKKYAEENRLSNQTLLAIESGANVNFDKLRFISEVSEFGERRESLLAVTIPEEKGSFREFCRVIGEHSITEFNYRFAKDEDATILAGVQIKRKDGELDNLIAGLESKSYIVKNLTENSIAKRHVRNMVGGHKTSIKEEAVFTIDFPERAGALMDLLELLGDRWNISMFHYRNEGSIIGKGLIGLHYNIGEKSKLISVLDKVGYNYVEKTDDDAYKLFLG
ncbi:MAG: threonine ammonia-lyase, biosynthetic [Spirochaetaceae bacterium]